MIALSSDLIFGIFSTGVGSVLLFGAFREIARAVDSEDWPEVPGEIEETGVLYEGRGFSPEVRYHYRVGDSQYVSDRIAFGGRVSMSFRFWAEGIVARYRQSKMVRVRVCPNDPDLSVLEPGVHWSCWFILILAAVFVALGIRALLVSFGVLG